MIDRFNAWATVFVGRLTELKSDEGQTFVEYALVLAVVVVGVLLAVTWGGLGTAMGKAISSISTAIGG